MLLSGADFNKLDDAEKKHFYRCKQCGEMVDKRQLDDVLFHEEHKPRPDIQLAARNACTLTKFARAKINAAPI